MPCSGDTCFAITGRGYCGHMYMRDRLIHGYATVDLEIVWHTINDDLPPHRSELESLIGELED